MQLTVGRERRISDNILRPVRRELVPAIRAAVLRVQLQRQKWIRVRTTPDSGFESGLKKTIKRVSSLILLVDARDCPPALGPGSHPAPDHELSHVGLVLGKVL